MMVKKKVGKKWKLYDSSGKRLLGTHSSLTSLERQEKRINIEKARKAGHKIPRKKKK